ncbi:MAG: ATP-binding protein [Desulfovibrionales bacterium]
MRFLSTLRFQSKINLGITLIIFLIALLLSIFVSRMAGQALIDENKKRGSSLVENLAGRTVDPLLAVDFLRLKNLVEEILHVSSDVEYAFVMDGQSGVLVHTFKGGFPVELVEANTVETKERVSIRLLRDGSDFLYDFAAPVKVAENRIGTVRVGLSREEIQQAVNSLVLAIFGLSGGVLAGAMILSTVFSHQVTQRIHQLRRYAEEVVRGNLDVQTGPELEQNCWEIMNCDKKECPAYKDKRRRCWYLAGTLCPNCDPSEYPGKLRSCRTCTVYMMNRGDEIQELAETFDLMALSLKKNIEGLKDAEKSLTRQQQLLRTILDVTPDHVCLLDEHLRYKAVNRSFAGSLDLTEEDIVGKTVFDLFPRECAEKMDSLNREVLETGKPVYEEEHEKTADGEHWQHVVKVPVFDSRNRVAGVLHTARDVSEIKSYQEQLIQAQKMESLGKLAGGVAHEINTPLGIILGYAQLLKEEVTGDEQVAEDLMTIEKQAKICRKIVADLLGFSRQHESELASMDLNHSILEVVSLVRHTFYLDQVEIRTELDESMPSIIGDREKLKQVWMNLLGNALDAMEKGGVITIRTGTDASGKKAEVSIADSGSGISNTDLKKIFDPFFSTKGVGKGTGLGLSVSFGIIEAHGGTIEVQSPCPPEFFSGRDSSELGPGTLFVIQIPLPENEETKKA